MKLIRTLALAATFTLASTAAYSAPVCTINGCVNATSALGASSSPFTLANFGSGSGFITSAPQAFDGAVITFGPNVNTPNSGVYGGEIPSIVKSPYAGTNLGTPTSTYLAAQPGNTVTFDYGDGAERDTFNLLWGTVDTYNDVTFSFFAGGVLLGSQVVTGTDIATSAGISPNGGTPAFVTLSAANNVAFNRVIFTSTSNAFEFVPGAVPEPAAWAMMISGFGLVGGAMRSRRQTLATA